MTPEQLERDLAAVADRGLTHADYRRAVLERVTAAVPATASCFAAADPATLALIGHTSQGVERRGADRLYEAEYGVPDVASHRSLAAGAPVRVLSHAARGDVARSHRYRSLLEPMGWKHELRAATTDRGGTWGFLHLYRDAGSPDFSADEAALIERIGPRVASGLRAAMLNGVPSLVPGQRAPAVWVLDDTCRVQSATPSSDVLLAALRDDETPDDETPEVLVGLAVMARAAAAAAPAGDLPPVPRLQVPTSEGTWLSLHASVLEGGDDGSGGQVVITSTQSGAADLLDLALLAHRLTPAECTAVRLVLAGRSTKQIAEELVLSPHTVQDRMQDVFEKVGVRSRRELVAKLA